MSSTQWVDKAGFNGSPYYGNTFVYEALFELSETERRNSLRNVGDKKAVPLKRYGGNTNRYLAV